MWYALLAWFAAALTIPYFPEGTQIGKFGIIAPFFGALVGWTFAGPRAGDTMRAAYGYGLTAAFLIVVYNVIFFAGEEMLQRSIKKRYDGPMEALSNSFVFMREFAIYALKWDVLTILILGGLFGGWLVEKTGRKWS
jgi:hypothetical protein